MASQGRGIEEEMKNGWVITSSGWRFHYVNGFVQSVNDQPSAISPEGHLVWHKNDMWHRETGPAWINHHGDKQYRFYDNYYPEIKSDLEWVLKVEELKKSS